MAGRWHRRRRRQIQLERHPDQLPKRGLFTEPVRVTQLRALEPEDAGGHASTTEEPRVRVTFLIEIRDAEDRRCPDLAVDARVHAPDRTGDVQGATDMFGRVKVQVVGPAGTYSLEVLEVAAKALDYDPSAGPSEVSVEVSG